MLPPPKIFNLVLDTPQAYYPEHIQNLVEYLRWSLFAKIVNSENLGTIFAKTLHHRLLIGFLNTSASNTVKKLNKRHLPNHIKHFVFLFL